MSVAKTGRRLRKFTIVMCFWTAKVRFLPLEFASSQALLFSFNSVPSGLFSQLLDVRGFVFLFLADQLFFGRRAKLGFLSACTESCFFFFFLVSYSRINSGKL